MLVDAETFTSSPRIFFFAAAYSAGITEFNPTFSVYYKYGSACGTGGGHVHDVARRYRQFGHSQDLKDQVRFQNLSLVFRGRLNRGEENIAVWYELKFFPFPEEVWGISKLSLTVKAHDFIGSFVEVAFFLFVLVFAYNSTYCTLFIRGYLT